MAIGGAGNYGFLFNSTGTNNNVGLANALFGSKNTMLSDYSMIKSGAYKKLLTAYYKSQETENDSTANTKNTKNTKKTDRKDTSNSKSSVKTTEENSPNLVAKSAADHLKNSAVSLQRNSLYKETGKDEDGNATYNRDDITAAVKSFVSDYNSAVSSANKTSSATVQSKALNLTKATASNSKLLKEIGITVGKENELVIDEDKLGKAKISTLKSLFTGSGSYADRVANAASTVSKAAYAAANSTSSYSQSGAYKSTDISSLLDQYM
ncbi:MAG: hypothetical protein IJ733_10355 [Lachnospiraceae bacterium]|nr:hypothetical protein [Lachnospiraceae bacterium]